MKVITKVKAIGKASIVCLSVLVSINANAQSVEWASNVTVSEVLFLGPVGYFRTVEPIENPAQCPNTNWYAIDANNNSATRADKIDLIKSSMAGNLPINVIIRSDQCYQDVYPWVWGVGSS